MLYAIANVGKKVHGNNVHGKNVHGKMVTENRSTRKKRPRNKGPSENEEGGKNVHIRAEKSSTYYIVSLFTRNLTVFVCTI